MLERLIGIIGANGFARGTEVFPDIDIEGISSRLKLAEQGTGRGTAGLPAPDQKSFDSIEMQVIDEIETLRRRGLQQFEDHLRVYRERLSRATEARKEVEIVAGTAKGDFLAEVQVWKARFVPTAENLKDHYDWHGIFREQNRLHRPAAEFTGWLKVIALGMLLLLVESVLNGYLFAQNNVLGLFGGVLAALLVSIANVGVSTLCGFFTRYLNCRNLLWKLLGLGVLTFWLCYAAGFNLAVAHFRDGVEQSGNWSLSAEQALITLRQDPLGIGSIESWLLVIVGLMISLLAFLKGLHIDDKLPGYGTVSRGLEEARYRYSDLLEEAIAELEGKRNIAIDSLREAHEAVRDGIGEAVDALFGQSSLKSQVGSFVEQCEVKSARLLSIYRDANIAARKTPAPESFSKNYTFAEFTPPKEEQPRRASAEKEAEKVGDLVDATIREIFDSFGASVLVLREMEEVQGNAPPRAAIRAETSGPDASAIEAAE